MAGFRQHHGGGHGHHVLYHGSVLGYQGRHMAAGHHHIATIPAHSSIPLNASEYYVKQILDNLLSTLMFIKDE